MAGVTLDDLTIRFGDVLAVDQVSLTIADGEFIVLLGPSGCGKTTTLRCVAGLEQATSGRILFNGAPVGHLSPKAREVAMVFQFVSLYPHMSVRENIAFPLKARGERGVSVTEKVNRIAEVFDLGAALGKRPRSLPPGTWQKASLARAVVREPKVLLLDEPLSAIDEQFREEMRWELRHIQKELGMTTIHVTHDQREAMSLADRVVLMRDGRIVQEGPPTELYDAPADLFAAHFIGSPSMNLIPARIDGGHLHIGAQAMLLPTTLKEMFGRRELTDITVGIRPHDTTVGQPDGSTSTLNVAVGAVTSQGREKVADFELEGHHYKGLLPHGADPGTHSQIHLDPAHMLFFDSSGARFGDQGQHT